MATKNVGIYYKVGDEYRELISLRDAGKMVGQSMRSVQYAVGRNELMTVEVASRVFFDADELRKWKGSRQ